MAVADAVVVSTARTAIGTAFKGTLVDVDAFELGTTVVAEAVRRAGVDPSLIDDVVLGEALYGGGDIARYAAIEAGLDHVAGLAHNRHCAAGLAAVTTAAATIRAGMDRVVVAGGAHSSSNSPRSLRRTPGSDDWDDWFSPPIAMTGARVVVTLVHELRRRGGGTGVAAKCAGGGMSTAVVLDVPAP
jgi:acetyl-CoA acetyltransferase